MPDYHVNRHRQTLGVYPEADARDYYAQGRIAADDLVWCEGMPAWLPAAQVFGPLPQAPTEPAAPPLPAATEMPVPVATSAPAADAESQGAGVPLPPKLHWGVLLLLTVLTLGIFYVVWMFIQASWVRKINPRSNAMTLFTVYLVLVLVGEAISGASEKESAEAAVGSLLVLVGSIVSIVGIFSLRRSMLDYYNRAEPVGLRLSAALTFFLGIFYIQYHMMRIRQWKETGILPL